MGVHVRVRACVCVSGSPLVLKKPNEGIIINHYFQASWYNNSSEKIANLLLSCLSLLFRYCCTLLNLRENVHIAIFVVVSTLR